MKKRISRRDKGWVAVLAGAITVAVSMPSLQAQPTALTPAAGAIDDSGEPDYKKLGINELLDLEITTVSRTVQRLSRSPSAVQVVSGLDVQRSGARTLVDALRLAPNVQVQQVNSAAWVASTRGFNAVFANKLLVMIDGRSVYTPLHAGVFWDAQNILLEDLERIEIVSGPGGSLWGANAVNGVINIITKDARETQGTYVSAGAGSFLRDFAAIRYGGGNGSNVFYRVYAQHFDHNDIRTAAGARGTDQWNLTQGGFRMDYLPFEGSTFTLQGDLYGGEYQTRQATNSTLDGQNILGRWTRTLSDESEFILQAYVDRTWRRDINSALSDQLTTYDIDFQHRFPLPLRQSVLWGLGYRLMDDETATTTPLAGFVPANRRMHLFSGFIQDEITVIEDRLTFTAGTKIEHNEFTEFEIQPSVRIAWTPTEKQTVWGALSRAVRSPSRIDVDYHIPKTPPYAVAGGPDFKSEELLAWELGYRLQPAVNVSLSVAAFYHSYDNIFTVELANPPDPLPYTAQNGIEGQSWGLEFSGTWQPLDRWRLRGGYTYFHKDLWLKPGHTYTDVGIAALGNDPEHQIVIQSILDLPAHFQFDLVGRYVGSLPAPHVDRYFTFDARLAWRYRNLEIALSGQNLAEKDHIEFGSGSPIPRSVFGSVTCRF